jgi:hypothetical protein
MDFVCIRAFVPAVLLGEAEPKGAEASQKSAEPVVSCQRFDSQVDPVGVRVFQ